MANTNQLARLLSESVKITDFGSFKVKQRSGVCQGKAYSTNAVKFSPFLGLSSRVK